MLDSSATMRGHPGGGTESKDASICYQSLLIIFTQQWKCFQPEVRFESGEVLRLLNYEKALVFGISSPLPSFGPPASLSTAGENSGMCYDESPASCGESSVWDDEPLYESPVDFFRSLPQVQRTTEMQGLIEQEDRQKVEMRDRAIQQWLDTCNYSEHC